VRVIGYKLGKMMKSQSLFRTELARVNSCGHWVRIGNRTSEYFIDGRDRDIPAMRVPLSEGVGVVCHLFLP